MWDSQGVLPVSVELFYDGQWNEVPCNEVDVSDEITVQRGRADLQDSPSPSQCTLKLDNTNGKYTPRNPLSPLFGKIGRNTSLRWRVGDSAPGLELDGGYASTPDSEALDILGDLDVRVDVEPVSWLTENQTLAAKYGASGQRSWMLQLFGDGQLVFYHSETGGGAQGHVSAALPVGGRLTIRATLDVEAGQYVKSFYYGPSLEGPWTLLDESQGLEDVSLFDSTTPLTVGMAGDETDPLTGSVFGVQVRDGIDGAVVAGFNGDNLDNGSFTGTAGETWTVHSGAVLADSSVRFCGEVATWPTRWDVEDYAWAEVEAYGIRRRLAQGAGALRSPMYRAVTSYAKTTPVAYWPCEDGDDATRFMSASDGPDMTVGLIPGFPTRDVRFSAYSDFVSSDSVPEFSVTSAVGQVPFHAPTGELRAFLLMHIPDDGLDGNVQMFNLQTTGSAAEWGVEFNPSGSVRLLAWNSVGDSILSDGFWIFHGTGFNGRKVLLSLHLQQNGGNIDYELRSREEFGSDYALIDTLNNRTVGRARGVVLSKVGDAKGTAMGHVSVFDEGDDALLWAFGAEVLQGWKGERALERIQRLAGEEDIAVALPAGVRSEKLGYQGLETTLDLLDGAAETDSGIMHERRDACMLQYRPRVSLYNQVALELDYCQVSNPFEPTDDDQHLVNDWTVEREGGGSARAVKDTGVLSVEDVGRYDDSISLSLNSDGQATNQATWRLHLGTVDESRYPQLHVSLYGNNEITPDVLERVLAIDVGDRITVSSLPSFLAERYADLMVQGYTETTDGMRWDFTFNCTPASPWTVGIAEDPVLGRADTAGSELAEDVGSTQTSFEVSTLRGPNWTTDPAEFPFDLKMGGEEITVTGIDSAVVDTFTRNVANGWGSSDNGQPWTVLDTPERFSVDGSTGRITLETAGVEQAVALNSVGVTDFEMRCTLSVTEVAVGGWQFATLFGRYVDSLTYYAMQVEFKDSGIVGISLYSGQFGFLQGAEIGAYLANEPWRARFKVTGTTLRAKLWKVGDPEPKTWRLRATSTDVASGLIGVAAETQASNTNVPVTFVFDDYKITNPQTFTVTRSVNGIVKSHPAGTAVSLAHPAVVAL